MRALPRDGMGDGSDLHPPVAGGDHAGVSLTVCIMTLDEEENLPRLFASIEGLGAEIAVLDSHSTDRTREIAREAGALVLEEDWRGWTGQRTRTLELGTGDWILCMDADEWLEEELRDAILAAMRDAPEDVDGFALNRRTHYLGGWIDHCGWSPEWRVRLVRRGRVHCVGTDPHDRLEVDGRAVNITTGRLNHIPYPTLAAHIGKVNHYTTEMARQRALSGVRPSLSKLLLRPAWRFFRMYVMRAGFLDGWRGLVLCSVGGFYVFLKYAKLREFSRVSDRGGLDS
jgi:glycosyltransferase involved in cell wall biosynthesis